MTTYEAQGAYQEPSEGHNSGHFDAQALVDELTARSRACIDGAVRALVADQAARGAGVSDEQVARARARDLRDDISDIQARIAATPAASLEEVAASRRRQREALRHVVAEWTKSRGE